MPFSPGAVYESETDRCRKCEMEGDFAKANDKAISIAVAEAKKVSVASIINYLAESGKSMAYIERAFDLPQRTLMRWKGGDLSAGGLALLRLVATFPWTVEVAEAQFNSVYATQRLAHEGINAMSRLAQFYNIDTKVNLSSIEKGVKVDVRLVLPSNLSGCQNTGSETMQPKEVARHQ